MTNQSIAARILTSVPLIQFGRANGLYDEILDSPEQLPNLGHCLLSLLFRRPSMQAIATDLLDVWTKTYHYIEGDEAVPTVFESTFIRQLPIVGETIRIRRGDQDIQRR